jgi:hypothetical protein
MRAFQRAPLRLAAGLALALLAAALAACDAGRGNPFASFDARCAKLPPLRVSVAREAFSHRVDGERTLDELTVLGGNTPATHRTYGLTTVRFGHQTDIDIKVIEDAAGERACGAADVRVTLSMQPVVVHVARELVRTPCAREATLAHELKHVESFRSVLDEAARDLTGDLAEAIGTEVRRAKSGRDLQRAVQAQVEAYLSVFVAQWQRDMTARQSVVDSEDEYRRVAGACTR